MKQIVTSEFWRNTKAESSQQENCYLKTKSSKRPIINYCIAENWVEDFLANVCGGSPLDLYNCTISIILTIFSIIISHTGLLLTKTLVTLNPIWVAGGGDLFQHSKIRLIPFLSALCLAFIEKWTHLFSILKMEITFPMLNFRKTFEWSNRGHS